MPSSFSRDHVTTIASLASLELGDDELELFATQLARILEYAQEIQRVDTSDVPPTASVVTRHAADRDDVPQPGLSREAALSNAPDASPGGDLFRVPKVIG
jgi:aspartyl-tRNA(Asn)/glutamyl-tRNA(Gln) amidotransferase subunit C